MLKQKNHSGGADDASNSYKKFSLPLVKTALAVASWEKQFFSFFLKQLLIFSPHY
jgi:hypothetical protein